MQAARAIQNLQPSYIRTILKAAQQPGVISLAGGLPAESLFPIALIQEVANRTLEEPDALQYGTTEGDSELIKTISDREKIPTSNLLITHGAQQGLDLTARLLLNSGDTVVMEAPSYLGAIQVFQLAQAQIKTVTHTSNGPDLLQLEKLFQSQQIKLFYCIPDFHNPTGYRWSLEKRRAVLQLAKAYGVVLLEDAPYRSLRFQGEALPSLLELERRDLEYSQQYLFSDALNKTTTSNVIHLGSLSKILAPGLRIGFVAAPHDALTKLNTIKQTTDLHTSTLGQRIAAAVLQHKGFTEHLANLKQYYGTRCQLLCDLIEQELGEQMQWQRPDGGMFLWVKTQDLNSDLLAKNCLDNGVAIVPSSVFYAPNSRNNEGDYDQAMRLNFSHSTPDELEAGVSIIKRTIQQLNKKNRFSRG